MPFKVAYLGPEGTYTHQAAIQQFGNGDAELVPQPTIKSCFSLLEDEEVDFSVVPFENSTNGQVALAYDLICEWMVRNPNSGLRVVYEQFVAIHHCVLTHSTDMSKVKKIYTHPQAWGQVTNWLFNHPHIEKIDTSSTSKAAEIAAEMGDGHAAISSEYASKVHNVPILHRNVENVKDNTTRFLVLSKHHQVELPQKYITLLAFTVEHEDPGALVKALQVLTDKKINLTSITSRPSIETPWHYIFFIEFWIDQEKDKFEQVVEDFSKQCLSSVILGRFARSERYYGGN
ncbi:prephenate dehydratase PHA2 [Cyberlindnera jadinii NRRL Y-1542]|uniref:prephenate dehydratase n=1 Tax=Cyberlindnera jadinii (strain ATCC 18201 / CBS 1600 / BCRC 20928 / JCM 3617 / NBRC 0987 / NRRL Y-1542) TaxID=983966 RepID=A0A1E4S020_CYBJN|nr:PDT-domain-containing protein [Cyberlindnera jadinii NRRL Y-1542]ODV72846.1 PDT-domain-containing protein [Cyberlindnera jadinii NRRL Y-1542]